MNGFGRRWTGPRYRASVISAHRTCLDNSLMKELPLELREIVQRMSDRIGVTGDPVQPDMLGLKADPDPLPEGPAPKIGPGTIFPNIRRSAEFLQAQPWLVPSVEMLCEWELRTLGRPKIKPLRVADGAALSDIWQPLCAWAAPLRRDRQGRFRLARRAAEYLLGVYPWDAGWIEGATEHLPKEIRETLERKAEVWLDYARDTGCHCRPCISRREEVAAAKKEFVANYGQRGLMPASLVIALR